MLKNKVLLEVELNKRCYQLYCESDSPLGELHDALMHMKGYTVERMQSAQLEEQAIKEKMTKIDTDCCKE